MRHKYYFWRERLYFPGTEFTGLVPFCLGLENGERGYENNDNKNNQKSTSRAD